MSSTSNSALAVATSDFGLFLPPNLAPPNASFAVSIVDLCNPRATYAIQCINPVACGHDNPILTVTEDISEFLFATQTITSGSSVSVSQSCTITGGYSAVCVADYHISADGTKTTSAVTNAFTNGNEVDAHIFAGKFTGGVAKITNITLNTCSAASETRYPFSTILTGLGIVGALTAILSA